MAPILAGEVTIGVVPSTPTPLTERASDRQENAELPQSSGTEAPSSEPELPPKHTTSERTAVPEKPVHSDRFAGSRTDSKDIIFTEAGDQLNAPALVQNKEVDRLKPEESESRDGLPSNRNRKPLVSAQIETSKGVASSEKSDLGAIESRKVQVLRMHGRKSPPTVKRLQETNQEAASLTSRAVKRVVHSDASLKQKQAAASIANRDTDGREVLSTLPNIKVTIGRIDVRAVKQETPSPLQRRKTSSKPKLSLDDYLKQRNRGQR